MESEEIKSQKKLPLWAIIVAIVAVIAVIAVVFVTVSGSSTAKRAEKKLSLAEHYMTELKYEEAIALYKEVLEIEPKSIEAYKGLFEAYIATGDEAKAQEILDRAKGILTAEELARMQSTFEEKYRGAKDSGTGENENISASGKLTKELLYDGDGTLIDSTEYIYGANGELAKCVSYDYAGKVVGESEFDADGRKNSWWMTYYADGSTFKRVTLYDANRRLLKQEDYTNGEIGYKAEYEYDDTGKYIKSTVYLVSTYTDGEGNIIESTSSSWSEYQYSDNGRKATVIEHKSDGSSKAHDEEYDKNGRCVAFYFDDTEHRYWYEHAYDSEGNEIKNMYFHEGALSFGYEYILNADGDYAEYISYSNGIASRTTYKYEYDNIGNKTKCLEYDSDGNLTGWTEYVYE